jgi:hypothetical protein
MLTDEQDALRVVGATRAFLRFLSDGGLLGPASALGATKGWAALARKSGPPARSGGRWFVALGSSAGTAPHHCSRPSPVEVSLDRYLVTKLALAYADDEHVAFGQFVDRGAHHLRRAVALAEPFRTVVVLDAIGTSLHDM